MQAHLSWWASTPSTAEMAAPLRVNFSGTLQNSFDENVKKIQIVFLDLKCDDWKLTGGRAPLQGRPCSTGRHTWRLPANCAKHFNTSYCLKCWISFFSNILQYLYDSYNVVCKIFLWKITSLLYPPSRPYTMGTLPSKRLRRAFNNYNLYILMNTQ